MPRHLECIASMVLSSINNCLPNYTVSQPTGPRSLCSMINGCFLNIICCSSLLCYSSLLCCSSLFQELELRIETQKQTLQARDESIKKLLEMLQNKGVGKLLFEIFCSLQCNLYAVIWDRHVFLPLHPQ